MRRTAEQARETRATILRAGLASFAELGWEATSFVGVGARARVTRGAVHHHFSDKLALLTAALEEGWAEAVGPLLVDLREDALSGEERLLRFLGDYINGLSEDQRFRDLAVVSTIVAPQAVALEKGIAAKHAAMSPWEDAIGHAISDAALRPGVTGATAVLAVVTAIHGLTVIAATQRSLLPSSPEATHSLAVACIRGALN